MAHDKQPYDETRQRREDETPRQQLEAFHTLDNECRECRRDIEPHWQFCAHCGVRLATSCPGCGTPLPPAGAAACPHCGLAIPQPGT